MIGAITRYFIAVIRPARTYRSRHDLPLAIVLIVLAAHVAMDGQAFAAELKPPFDIAKQRAMWQRKVPAFGFCPAPPRAVRDLTHVIFYSDRAQSVIDAQRMKQNMANSAGIRAYATALNRMADEYVVSSPPDRARAACVLHWLASWAQQDALLGDVEFWARFDTVWFGAIPANFAYLKIKDDPQLDPRQRAAVERWLVRLAEAGIQAEEKREASAGPLKVANILYWVGAAAILSGVSANDRTLFDYGVSAARRGLDTVRPDGLLPAELSRKGRAFAYMKWAAEPMAIIVATAKANGVDLTGVNDEAFRRLFEFFADTIRDPARVEAIAGTRQDTDPAKWPRNGGDLTAVEIFLSIMHNDELDAIASRMRPVVNQIFGGNYSQLFAAGPAR